MNVGVFVFSYVQLVWLSVYGVRVCMCIYVYVGVYA